MITYDLNLCLGKNNSDKRLAVKCHDTGVKLRVYLQVCRHGKWRDEYDPYIIPSGTTAVLKIVKPDKKYCITEGVVESDDILFAMNPQAFTTAGISQAEVSLFGPDGKRITSGTFDIEVPEECICGCDLESENYIDVMSEQIRAAIDAADRAEAAVTHGPIIKGGTWWLWNPEQSKYEDSGVCASADQGVVKTVNGISPDENGNVEVESSGGVIAAKVTQTDSGAVITITDKSGTTTATIVNGKDGADGAKGEKGDTGAPGADGAKGEKGDTGAQGEPGEDGTPGKDGVSATHSWNGTVLTITSASGTSSADLKGAKGDKGDPGDDYVLTEADKAEIAEQAAQLVDVPTDAHINDLINTALSAIPNAAEVAY